MSDLSKDSALKSTRVNTRKIAFTAIFTAMAVVLMYLEVSVPLMPPFLKFGRFAFRCAALGILRKPRIHPQRDPGDRPDPEEVGGHGGSVFRGSHGRPG